MPSMTRPTANALRAFAPQAVVSQVTTAAPARIPKVDEAWWSWWWAAAAVTVAAPNPAAARTAGSGSQEAATRRTRRPTGSPPARRFRLVSGDASASGPPRQGGPGPPLPPAPVPRWRIGARSTRLAATRQRRERKAPRSREATAARTCSLADQYPRGGGSPKRPPSASRRPKGRVRPGLRVFGPTGALLCPTMAHSIAPPVKARVKKKPYG